MLGSKKERHTCPRRVENGMDIEGALRGSGPNKDTYEPGHGLVGQVRGCSYCGSMSPEDFMQAVKDGKSIGPTDKSYKLYVSEPLTDEQKRERLQEQVGRYVGMGMSEDEAKKQAAADPIFGEGEHIGKFYTQHLSEEQGFEFHMLWIDKKINWGYPGAPYVRLFIPGPSTKGRD